MSSKKLLTQNETSKLKDSYHKFLLEKKSSGNEKTLEDFYTELKAENPEFNKFTSKQLSNQIIAYRRTDGSSEWPNFEEYKSYISLKGRSFIQKSINSCLLAVEVYNKPTSVFRTENYILLMMISWTSALHALFNENGIKYKDDEDSYYELSRCVSIYQQDSSSFEKDAISENILFLYELRNEITHRSAAPLDEDVFGECQACLYNLQDFLFYYWGDEFQLGISLAHSLQFSRSIREQKIKALKKHEASKVKDMTKFMAEYKAKIKDEKPDVYNNPRFSFKVFMIPKLANKDKNSDLAVEFIKYSDLDKSDIEDNYEKLLVAIKDINIRVYRPGEVSEKIEKYLKKENSRIKFTAAYHHSKCADYYKIREGKNTNQPNKTKTEYCRYNPTYNTYEYTSDWIKLLKEELNDKKLKEILAATK